MTATYSQSIKEYLEALGYESPAEPDTASPEHTTADVRKVSVSTLAITVQSLTFGNRQVSKSAFNQFVNADLIAEDGTLNGQPVGWANYHPDKWCGSHPDDSHWHVIWTLGGNLLRRSIVVRRPRYEPYKSKACDALFWAAVRNSWWSSFPISPVERRNAYDDGGYKDISISWLLPRTGVSVSASPDRNAMSLFVLDKALRDNANNEDPVRPNIGWGGLEVGALAGALKKFSYDPSRGIFSQGRGLSASAYRRALCYIGDLIAKDGSAETYDDCLDRATAEVAAEAARRKRHREVRLPIGEMPQLFIAA